MDFINHRDFIGIYWDTHILKLTDLSIYIYIYELFIRPRMIWVWKGNTPQVWQCCDGLCGLDQEHHTIYPIQTLPSNGYVGILVNQGWRTSNRFVSFWHFNNTTVVCSWVGHYCFSKLYQSQKPQLFEWHHIPFVKQAWHWAEICGKIWVWAILFLETFWKLRCLATLTGAAESISIMVLISAYICRASGRIGWASQRHRPHNEAPLNGSKFV